MIVRPLKERDWPTIDWLASNQVQEGDHSAFGSEWGQRRREFDGESVQSVLESNGEVVAYCSLERKVAHDDWRVFIVLDWSKQDHRLEEAAYSAVEKLVTQQGARSVWMRELTDDYALLRFVGRKGFEVERRYTLDGLEMVNLRKSFET